MHLRHTDGNGHTSVICHRVWDGDKFLAAQQDAAFQEAIKAKERGEPFRHEVELVDKATYDRERG